MNIGADYRVSGITYDPKTGRPVDVPENRKPVQARDNTTKVPPKPTPKPTTKPTKKPTATKPATSTKAAPAKKKTRTWLADNYKPGKGPASRSTAGNASNKPKQSARMRDALKTLKVRKY